MKMFNNKPDAVLMEMMRIHGPIIRGETRPTPKKHDTPENVRVKWEKELSFINLLAFINAVREADRRGCVVGSEDRATFDLITKEK